MNQTAEEIVRKAETLIGANVDMAIAALPIINDPIVLQCAATFERWGQNRKTLIRSIEARLNAVSLKNRWACSFGPEKKTS